MAFKLFVLACFVAAAQAAAVVAPLAYSSHYGGAPALSHYATAPALSHYATAPALSHYAAPALTHYAAPAVAKVVAPVAHYAAPVTKVLAAPAHYEHYPDAPAEYSFEYSVHDEHTGDVKSQKEVRHGDQVQGSYSLVEADGSRRVVEYTADEHNGFNAVVHREPGAHPVAYKPVVKVAAAPVLKVAAPVAHYAAAAPAYHGYAAAAPAYHGYAAAAPAYHGYAAAAPAYYHH